jgi:beta-glucosidase-like glycosyl hydrolase
MATTPTFTPAPEKYLVAFVIEGDDVFKVTMDNVVQAADGAGSVAFEGVAKLKAAVALFQLTNVHNERPNELRKMARELAQEGMMLLAKASAAPRLTTAPGPTTATPESSVA